MNTLTASGQSMKNLIIATLILAAPCWISRAAEKTRSNPAWQTKAGAVLDVLTNGVVIATFTIRTIEPAPPRPLYRNPMERSGYFLGGITPTTNLFLRASAPRKIKIPGPIIFIKNVPGNKEVGPNNEMTCRAMKTMETIAWNGKQIECWDGGVSKRIEPADEAEVEATNSPAKPPVPSKFKPLPSNRPPRVFN